ncbi:hypothetical protein BDW22DRAFT_1440088 [Trametopsis cervina]|nr:hypothetical protein BDW22DRAFT_1440088 [Trametopsis cervina]
MHTPSSSTASSPTFQHLSSQQFSNPSSHSNMNPSTSPKYTPSSRDTTPHPGAPTRTPLDQASPALSPPATPSSSSSYSSARSSSGAPVAPSSSRTPLSSATLPLGDSSGATDVRRAVGGVELPIDLRGLSTLPSVNAIPASTAVLGAAGRNINLPTLKTPQGQLLDLNELAGFGDGLTPTQETFPIYPSSLAAMSYDPSQSHVSAKSPPMAHNVTSPAFSNGSAFQSPSMSSNPSLMGLSSLPSLASIPSSLSSFMSTPSLASQPSPTLSSTGGSVCDGMKTPNVYINGLPPNFPEEDLLAMTKPFGEVVSVRTFTRHVSDKPSGYGFVLFGSVDAAEKCIESLRKYRNLHPSFSKQIHKIPGTPYATAQADPIASPPQMSPGVADSFKSKMEKLKDTSSTNLYMEGLPLSIDEETLHALVQPYRILSSRFFRTRLSNPPRIIAFVRLESRTAAEDIIERLHGRMVRGWCDAGSRISVRFADTGEQRELRRVERMNRDGENSPARLTMAQAALLNLKGTQLGPQADARLPSPNFGVVTLPPVIGQTPSPVEPASIPTQTGYRPLPPPIGLHHQQQSDPPTLRNVGTAAYGSAALGLGSLNAQLDDATLAALQSSYAGAADTSLLQMQMAGMDVGSVQNSLNRARNGFTPMERLILQAHEQRQQQEALAVATGGAFVQRGSDGLTGNPQRVSEFNPAASEFNPSGAALGRMGTRDPSAATNGHGAEGRRLTDFLPPISEQDFHARAPQQQTMTASKTEPKGLKFDQESRAQFTRQRNQTHAEARAQAEAEAEERGVHARSTTVPAHYLKTDASRTSLNNGHSSMNVGLGGLASMRSSMSNARDRGHSQLPRNLDSHSSGAQNPAGGLRNHNPRTGASVGTGHSAVSNMRSRGGSRSAKADVAHPHTQAPNARIDTAHSTLLNRNKVAHVQDGDDEDDGSGLDSPALSYSVRTPASLSPATPFSAFGETFDGPPMGKGDVGLGVGVHDVQVVGGAKGLPPMSSATVKH